MEDLLAKHTTENQALKLSTFSGQLKQQLSEEAKDILCSESKRLQRHMAALDLYSSAQDKLSADAFELASNTLRSIHSYWKPNQAHKLVLVSKEFEAEVVISDYSAELFEAINPSSAVNYLINLLIDLEEQGTALKKALVLDLLTAALSSATMMESIGQSYVTNSGKPAKVFNALHAFFWKKDLEKSDPLYFVNNGFANGLYPMIEHLISDKEYYPTWNNLKALKEAYYEMLAVIELTEEEISARIKRI